MYKTRIAELERYGEGIASHTNYNLLNVMRLQLDEAEILQANLDYLVKLRRVQ